MKTSLARTFSVFILVFLSGCTQLQPIPVNPFDAQRIVLKAVTRNKPPDTVASYQILDSHPGFQGHIVAYWMCRPAAPSSPAVSISGYAVVRRYQGGNQGIQIAMEGEGGLPAGDSLIEFIADAQGQGSEKRNILFGRVLTPEVQALEVVYADKQRLRWPVIEKSFLLFRQESVDWTELLVLGENDQVLKTYDLTMGNTSRSERDESGELNCPENASPIATHEPSSTPTSHSAIDFPTPIPLSSPTPFPAIAEPSPLPTLLTSTETANFCDSLAQTHTASTGFQTYCDDFGFAFDYPMTWRITYLTGSPDTPGTSTLLVRRAQRFEAYNMSNYIRTDTYSMPAGSTLAKQVEKFWCYPSREILDQPYDVRIGGLPAEVIINRWHQDYSAVYLFFQHGTYYSVMEIKAISHTGLDTNWEIAQSLQVSGAGASENVIPQNLIEDSHKLLP